MNKNQSKYQAMTMAVQDVFAHNQTALNGKVALSRKIDQLAQHLATIALADISGYAQQKKAAKQLMAEAAVAAPLSTFARDAKNPVLEKEVDFQLTGISKAQDAWAKNRSQLICDRAQTNLASLADYDIVSEQLTTLQQLIGPFDDVLTLPRAMRSTHKTATTQLQLAVRALLKTLQDLEPDVLPDVHQCPPEGQERYTPGQYPRHRHRCGHRRTPAESKPPGSGEERFLQQPGQRHFPVQRAGLGQLHRAGEPRRLRSADDCQRSRHRWQAYPPVPRAGEKVIDSYQ